MYYSYVEIEYVATSFFPARMDLALKLLRKNKKWVESQENLGIQTRTRNRWTITGVQREQNRGICNKDVNRHCISERYLPKFNRMKMRPVPWSKKRNHWKEWPMQLLESGKSEKVAVHDEWLVRSCSRSLRVETWKNHRVSKSEHCHAYP